MIVFGGDVFYLHYELPAEHGNQIGKSASLFFVFSIRNPEIYSEKRVRMPRTSFD
jgi:hypothetical protein